MSSQQQLGLFGAVAATDIAARFVQKDLCAKRHGGNAESQEAHDSVRLKKERMWLKILEWACRQPYGFTADDCTAAFKCSPNHCAPRITEMLAQGLLVRTIERRKTRSGCMASVLMVKK